jgi:hypothetical protein
VDSQTHDTKSGGTTSLENSVTNSVVYSSTAQQVRVLLDVGEGRPLIILYDESRYSHLVESTAQSISAKTRVLVLSCEAITAKNWKVIADQFCSTIKEKKVRQASYVCFGSTANIVEDQLLTEPKSVRTLVIVDSPSRPHPTSWDRLVDRMEQMLPLGLPLRLGSSGFNVRAFLHRIRCPLLVVTTPFAGTFLHGDAAVVAKSAPTAWRISLTEQELQQGSLSETILKFQDTPAKCPQKNVKE